MPYTYFVVSHTHWDREWYQPFQEFRIRLVHLVDRLLDLLDADPSYRYFMLDGQTIVLEDYLAVRPQRRADVERHIRNGRVLVGPWYVLPDEFLVSPEALVRNLLIGRRIAQRFGQPMNVGYIPDTFGHISQLPQVFAGFGLDCAALWRGLPPLPTEFIWQAPDGSSVLAINLREGYGDLAWAPGDPDGFTAAVRLAANKLRDHTTTPNLLLMDGTDHLEPRADLPALLAAANARLAPDEASLIHSTLPQYVDAVRAAAPALQTVSGEFRHSQRNNILPAVLSSRTWIKQRNRASEMLLTAWAEPFSAIAAILDPTPTDGLRPESRSDLLLEAWRLLLQNQPHDSICGCSVDQVHEEMRIRFDQADQIGNEVTRQSLADIVAHVASTAPGGGPSIPIVVFNPAATPADGAVTADIQVPSSWPAFQLVDAEEQDTPYEILQREELSFSTLGIDEADIVGRVALEHAERIAGQGIIELTYRREADQVLVTALLGNHGLGDETAIAATAREIRALLAANPGLRMRIQTSVVPRLTISFLARQVPGCGYATYFVQPTAPHSVGRAQTHPAAMSHVPPAIENALLRVEVDPADGTLTLHDRRTGATYRGLNRFVDDGDRGDEYNYCPVQYDIPIDHPSQPPSIRLVDGGAVSQTLEVTLRYELPRALASDRLARSSETMPVSIVTRATLINDLPRLDLEVTINNTAQDHRLRAAFPFPAAPETWRTHTPFDVVERPVALPGLETDPRFADWQERPVAQQPQLAFCDLSTAGLGLMLANRGLAEVEARRDSGGESTTLLLTLLRCVGWLSRDDLSVRKGHAGPGLPTPGAQCLGQQTFQYALIPHNGDWLAAMPHALAFAVPLRASPDRAHGGVLPLRHSFATVEPSTVALSTLKHTDDHKGLALRLWNASPQPVDATVRLGLAIRSAALARLDETPVMPIAASSQDTFTVHLRPRQAATLVVYPR